MQQYDNAKKELCWEIIPPTAPYPSQSAPAHYGTCNTGPFHALFTPQQQEVRKMYKFVNN